MTREAKLFKYAERGSVRKVLKCLDRKHASYRIDDQDRDGYTCLHYAARWGHSDLARALLKRKANPNIQTDDDKDTPLHMALVYHHNSVAELLVCNRSVHTDLPNTNGTVCDALLGPELSYLKRSRSTANGATVGQTRQYVKSNRPDKRRRSVDSSTEGVGESSREGGSHKELHSVSRLDTRHGRRSKRRVSDSRSEHDESAYHKGPTSNIDSDRSGSVGRSRSRRSKHPAPLRARAQGGTRPTSNPPLDSSRDKSSPNTSPVIYSAYNSPPAACLDTNDKRRHSAQSCGQYSSDTTRERDSEWTQQDWEEDLKETEARRFAEDKRRLDEERYYEALEREFKDDDYVGRLDKSPTEVAQQRNRQDWHEKLMFEMGHDYNAEPGFRGMDAYEEGYTGSAGTHAETGADDWMEAIIEERRQKMQRVRDAEQREKARFANRKRGAGIGHANSGEDESVHDGGGVDDRERESKRRREESDRIIREQEAETLKKRQGMCAELRLDYERRWNEFVNRNSVTVSVRVQHSLATDTTPDVPATDAHVGARKANVGAKQNASEAETKLLTYDSIPWPYVDPIDTPLEMTKRKQKSARAPQASPAMQNEKLMEMEKAILVMGVSKIEGAEKHKSRIRLEQRRWHPDKWPEALLNLADRDRVLQRVKQIAQMLNSEA
ncbi:hypothetical protein SARC_10710 [Sphaeroforma arctica JP610]|uniref:NF-kappa-B inhibitor-like protein 1 n=1 Tax=Sphaeroforma arctica JP610 TaxID=667725 RepID=A0A0L0FJ57_9EUKA|nr:hypothetical protein SARC_10710 [Sphaeroforma arctica JP610]KNC76812.1 hypothetical protein SARC_10710 [Sphaeroforma arctica JP610]|eukprot:XP_014150714.1 hypothetical protein SARC_10710 [Sphaeroforma arctica JP610]